MDDTEFQDALKTLLEELACMDEDDRSDAGLPDELAEVKRVRTYQDEGVLTRDAGLVVAMADGSEFQMTIIRSR